MAFAEKHPVGVTVTGEIKNITEFGLFIGLEGDIDGLVHLSDVSWDNASGEEILKAFQRGQEVEAIVLSLDPDKERISLGLKQASPDAWTVWVDEHPKGSDVTGTVVEMVTTGVVIRLAEQVEGLMRKSDYSRDDPEGTALKPGTEVQVQLTQVDRQKRKISLSIKALDAAQERKTMQEYTADAGSATSSLGEALSQALEKRSGGSV